MSTLVDQSLGKPIQGVSQQAEALRGQGQCTEQINYLPDPAVGLRKRPPSVVLKELPAYESYVDYTDENGDRILAIGETSLDILDMKGNVTPVTIASQPAFNYLKQGIIVSNRHRVAFLEKSLYVTNRTVLAKKDEGAVFADRLTDIAIIAHLGGQYSKAYTITIKFSDGNTKTVTYTTPDGSIVAHANNIKPSYITQQLLSSLDSGSYANRIEADKVDDHILIYNSEANTTPITSVTCSDDEGGVAMKCIYNTVKVQTDLPTFAPNNTVVTIAGLAGTEDDAYYRFVTDGGTTGYESFGDSGVWLETVKIGDEFEFDWGTLPVQIKYDSGTYTLDLVSWKGREIGDVESNETPSILNKSVLDVGTLQGRLALLSESTIVFSRTKRPDELWRRSIVGGIQIDDAIDGSGDASTGQHTFLEKVAQDLAILTREGQYVILGGTAITPDNIQLSLTTRATSLPTVPPVGVGGNLYFTTDNGDFMGLNEYYKEDRSYFSLPVSSHVNRYIQGQATRLKGSNPQRMIAMSTDDDKKVLYCYKFLFDGANRVQSAWFKLQFNNDVEFHSFTSNSMVLITKSAMGHVMEVIEFDSIRLYDIPFMVHLDRTVPYVLDADMTFEPHTLHNDEEVIYVAVQSTSAGLAVATETLENGRVKVLSGNVGDIVVGGFKYKSLYIPTAPRIMDRNNEVVQTGVLNVRALKVNVSDSGIFDWSIETDYGHSYAGKFSNRVWDSPFNIIGAEPLITKQWTIPWRGKSTDRHCTISCEEFTPHNISYIEYEGDLRKTKKRI